MSGSIDHAAEALRLLTTSPLTAEAQVHATLALVDAVREIGLLLSASELAPVDDDGGLVTYGGMEIRPGDSDPTPKYPGGGYCGARGPEHGGICTWGADHEGAHVAGNGMIAVEVWS